jgi:oxygen-independent coproporphyrinogen-3 oxidase
MAGLYLHIPFCRKACNYCNFHFSTSLNQKDLLLEALLVELRLRKPYLQGQVLNSVYFGGGTPSLLSAQELNRIWEAIVADYALAEDLEITLEANPDDLTAEYLQALRQTPVNRLSIGIQSFFEEDLQWMNRAHDQTQARRCIPLAQDFGFSQLSVDLIYGGPSLSMVHWAENLARVFEHEVPHFSAYALTVEPRTALAHAVEKGKMPAPSDQHTAEQFEYLLSVLPQVGYEQYEISNFCRPPHYARHNSSYWLGAHYLGLGPSAHSFNGVSRSWNVANNAQYIRALQAGELPLETELLSPIDQFNEYLMTALRTRWGLSLQRLRGLCLGSFALWEQRLMEQVQRGLVQVLGDQVLLTEAGKLLVDHILVDLFWEK